MGRRIRCQEIGSVSAAASRVLPTFVKWKLMVVEKFVSPSGSVNSVDPFTPNECVYHCGSSIRCVQSNIILLTQAFRKKFVIPDFQPFTAHIDELYESARSLSGGQVRSSRSWVSTLLFHCTVGPIQHQLTWLHLPSLRTKYQVILKNLQTKN